MTAIRRLIPAVLALTCLGLLMGCGTKDVTTPARYALTMNFYSMTPHVGQDFHLRVWHVDTGVEIVHLELEPITAADFTLTAPDILIAGETYYVDFFADLNANYAYDAPPVDHAWRRTVVAAAGGSTLNFTHDTNWWDIRFPADSL